MSISTRCVAPALFLLLASSGCRPELAGVDASARSAAAAPIADAAGYSEWTPGVNFGPTVNSGFDDQTPTLSPDGLALYFASNRPGGSGGIDLWAARRASANDPWGVPVNLGPTVNSSANEVTPFITEDGHRLYFATNRPGGAGDYDIVVSWRTDTHDDFAWEAPVNVGAPVNTPGQEAGVTIHGTEFYYAGQSTNGSGLDIYVSRMDGSAFTAPEVVQELSSAADDRRPSIRGDGREMVFSSNRLGTIGLNDIWSATRPGNGVPWSTPVNVGAAINTANGDVTPSLSRDGTMLLFASNRPGGSGGLDLYYSTRAFGGLR